MLQSMGLRRVGHNGVTEQSFEAGIVIFILKFGRLKLREIQQLA